MKAEQVEPRLVAARRPPASGSVHALAVVDGAGSACADGRYIKFVMTVGLMAPMRKIEVLVSRPDAELLRKDIGNLLTLADSKV